MPDSQDMRLSRIEDKLTAIQDALVTLARVEEKIADLEIRRQEQREDSVLTNKTIELLDRKIAKIGEKTDWHEKVIWYIVGGALVFVGSQILLAMQGA